MKGDNFFDTLRTAGMLGLSLTLTGRQCALLAELVNEVERVGVNAKGRIAAQVVEIKREVVP